MVNLVSQSGQWSERNGTERNFATREENHQCSLLADTGQVRLVMAWVCMVAMVSFSEWLEGDGGRRVATVGFSPSRMREGVS